jgi:hypothetical protein
VSAARGRRAAASALALLVAAACRRGAPARPAPVTSADAAAPASGHDVLRRMHARYAGRWYATLAFTQETELHLPDDSVRRETWYEVKRLPGLMRIDRGARDGRDVIVYRGDTTYRRRDGAALAPRPGLNELSLLDFDVYGQPPARTAAQLERAGFDLARAGAAVWDGRPVWIVGAGAGDTLPAPARRQFWVDRERLVVVRLLRPGFRDTSRTADVTFAGYRPLAGGWIAPEITVREGGRLLQRERYRDVRANVPLADSLFDPARLR